MRKIIFIVLIFSAFCFADEFKHKAKYKLNKDQAAWIMVKKKTQTKWQRYDFSWTLYQDTINIILHTKYNNFVKQIVLGMPKKRNLFKQKLYLTPKTPYDDDLSLFIEFDDFKSKNELSGITKSNTPDKQNSPQDINSKIKPPYAVFNVLVKDKKDTLDVEFFPKKALF